MGGEILLDVTRLVSRAWTKRRSTGIDRVCEAYCRHFKTRARAVVQHRGVVRVLAPGASRELFEMLLEPGGAFRSNVLCFAPTMLARSPSRIDGEGALYLNTSHTDFDLKMHHRWVAASNLRPVYFLHDLIPLAHPWLTSAHAANRHLGRVRGLIAHGCGAIVNSNATKADLSSFAETQGLAIPPVLVAPLAGAKLGGFPASGPPDAATRSTLSAGAALYFVSVGTIEQRKNYDMLARIFGDLSDRFGKDCPRLVIVGQQGPQSDAILRRFRADPRLNALVRFETNASDRELAAYIRGAQALLMPTHAEGYGLPVIEALALGTPVIASDLACFREIGQNIPFLLSPNDEDGWSRAITDFAAGGPERTRQLRLMPGFVPPTWDHHFAVVEAWLDRLPSLAEVEPERMAV